MQWGRAARLPNDEHNSDGSGGGEQQKLGEDNELCKKKIPLTQFTSGLFLNPDSVL